MDLNLKNKTVIVTGGGSGLGAAICTLFAQEGANVIVNYIVDEGNVKRFVNSLNSQYPGKSMAAYADITSVKDIENMLDKIIEVYDHIDILVNNAGVWPTAYVVDMKDEDWEKTIRINLTAPFLMCKRVVKHMIKSNIGGKIVNIVSQAAFHGSTSGHAHYAAAKGGLVTFTISLAREVAKYGINVTAVAPGMMRTPMNVTELSNSEKDYISRIPLGRIADPEEVAYSVLFLASNKADYITGATIDVSGGMLMR